MTPAEKSTPREHHRPAGERLDAAEIAALYDEHAGALRAFLLGVLRDPHLASDVLQATFAKAIESGHTAQQQTLKGWLFQVAYHEAMAVRRREGAKGRATQELERRGTSPVEAAETLCVRQETVEQVRSAVEQLPPEQREVVRLRMYEGQKFAEIAEQLKLPLGTVLTRMQLALKKLRSRLDPET